MLAIGAVVVLLGLAGRQGLFRSLYVCSACALTRSTLDQQIPLLDHSLFTYSVRTRPTIVSRAIQDAGCLGEHTHTWRFVNGSGNGVRCALGPQDAAWQASNSIVIAEFIRSVARCLPKEEARKWVSTVLDNGQYSPSVLLVEEFPESGIADCAEFQKWLEEHAASVEQQLAVYEKNR